MSSSTEMEPLEMIVSCAGNASAEHAERLWAEWREKPNDSAVTNDLIDAYMFLVEASVTRISYRIPRHVDRDELHAAAMEALYFSVQNFDSNLGTSFEGFARKKITGAILDLMRRNDGVPRNSRRANRRLNSASLEFQSRNGRGPCQEELAEELSLSPVELERLEAQARKANRVSLDATLTGSASGDGRTETSVLSCLGVNDNPLEHMIATETRDALVAALQRLPERHRAIMVLHYNEGIRFNEIAEAMGISEARISQIHSAAVEKLREYMVRTPVAIEA